MTWQRKTWTILLIATALVVTVTASVGAVIEPLPAPPPSSSARVDDSGHPTAPPASDSVEFSAVESRVAPVAVAVEVNAKVEAVRLLVLDDQGGIIQIWSNTGGLDLEPHMSARTNSVDGPLVPLIPEGALDEYRLLEEEIDWSVRGLVYSAD